MKRLNKIDFLRNGYVSCINFEVRFYSETGDGLCLATQEEH